MKKTLLITLILVLSFSCIAKERFFYEVMFKADGINYSKQIIESSSSVYIEESGIRFYCADMAGYSNFTYFFISKNNYIYLKLIKYVKE